MTDKSFGDHTNRNVVKNPLLSTAVTGLCFEDLSQIAVLLPVSQAQEVVTRPEPIGPQDITLGDPKNATNYPYGDANANIHPPHSSSNLTSPTLDITQKTDKQNENYEKPNVSKASYKSADHFDVNEYFARLQGTRYVSAPLNSQLREDKNANLEATEDNLEEINLNDDKLDAEVPQSFTSDIAQNFSQLPTVLPQVASAVFSSFSNMLSMKSREAPAANPVQANVPGPPGPPPGEPGGYKEVQFENNAADTLAAKEVPMLDVAGMMEAKEVAPPPKESPVIGTSGMTNYRLPTKKKYAQIPGLSSGDRSQIPYNPAHVSQPNAPPYFVPTPENTQHNMPRQDKPYMQETQTMQTNFNIDTSQIIGGHYSQMQQNIPPANTYDSQTSSYNMFNPDNYTSTSIATQGIKSDIPTTPAATKETYAQSTPQVYQAKPESYLTSLQRPTSSGVIPPPPMFSNARKDSQSSQSSVGMTILPPSVARRISGNHPVMKSHAQSTPFTQNIFVPAPVSDTEYNPEKTEHFGQAETTNFQQSVSAFAPYDPIGTQQTTSVFTPVNMPTLESESIKDVSSFVVPPPNTFSSGMASTLPPPPKSFEVHAKPGKTEMEIHSMLPPPPKSIAFGANVQNSGSIAPPPMFSASGLPTLSAPSGTSIPSIASPEVIRSTAESRELIAPPPTMFVPSSVATALSPPFSEHGPLKPASSDTSNAALNQEGTKSFPPPPTFFNPYVSETASETPNVEAKESTAKLVNLPPPPLMFNPITTESPGTPKMAQAEFTQNLPISASQFQPSTSVDHPKVMSEPPKDVGNLSYRMTKKKPQYYAGPIVGVGAISNNVKPVIPSVETNASPSTLFVPTPVQQVEEVKNAPQTDLNQYTVPFTPTVKMDQTSSPFDVSQMAENKAVSTNIGHPKDTVPNQQKYATVFDVSRSSSDVYENASQQKTESTGFGIIGSLKSKLGALDINKIQSSVTTFFDPAYNDVKKEASDPYSSTTNMPSFEHYARSQDNESANFQIFVPNAEQTTTHGQAFEQPMYPVQTQDSQQSYQTQYLYSHYPNQGQNYPPFSYYTQDQYVAASNIPSFNQSHTSTSNSSQHNIPENITKLSSAATELDNKREKEAYIGPSTGNEQDNLEKTTNNTVTTAKHIDNLTTDASVRHLFEAAPQKLIKSIPEPNLDVGTSEQSMKYYEYGSPITKSLCEGYSENSEKFLNLTNISQNKTEEHQKTTRSFGNMQLDDSSASNFFESIPTYKSSTAPHVAIMSKENSESVMSPSSTCAENLPLEDLVSKVLDESEDMSKLVPGYGWKESVYDTENKENVTGSGHSANIGPIDAFELQSEKDLEDSISNEMSATPLCGLSEMLASKSKELADLEQNLENLALQDTSRNIDTIFNRGSNVSFFEIDSKNAKVLDDSQESTDLNICETCREVNLPDNETTDLTKQLIENITSPIQLSNPVEVPLPESDTLIEDPQYFVRNQFEEISHITEETIETIQVQSATELLEDKLLNADVGWCPEKSIAAKVTELEYIPKDPLKSIGFLAGSSLFLDSSILPMPKNASDELKAEYKGHEESPVVLSREMSIPSAPPMEDEDNKSDGSIDVHSIEQDASKDFPGEEFIIEPSETDDDKIEFRERENSNAGETLAELETFATRVEKYKQLDQIVNQVVDQKSPVFSATSPSLPIASYFDTGNYAAETHYKNLSSPPNLSRFGVDSPPRMRIPPGFEEQYQNILTGLSNPGILTQNRNDPISDDSSTQTRRYSPTFSTKENQPENSATGFTVTSINAESVQDTIPANAATESYPVFDLFGTKNDDDVMTRSIFGTSNVSLTENLRNTQKPNVVGQHCTGKLPMMASIFGADNEDARTHIPHRLETFSSLTQQKKIDEDEFKPTIIPDIFSEPKEVSHEGFGFESFSTHKPQTSYEEDVKTKTIQNLAKKIAEDEFKAAIIPNIFSEPKEVSNQGFRFESFSTHKPQTSHKEDVKTKPVQNFAKSIAEDEFKPAIIPDIFSKPKEVSNEGFGLESLSTYKPQTSHKEDVKTKPVQNLATLPDPMNFFLTSEPSAQSKEDGSCNRLASYFASPSQPAPSKPFFELSQGQDHYRHNLDLNTKIICNRNVPEASRHRETEDLASKTIISLTQNISDENFNSNNPYNIPQSQYVANLNLISDLTSPQNLQVDPDQTVKTVNYFTVHYDVQNPSLKKNMHTGEPVHNKKTLDPKPKSEEYIDDKTLNDIIQKCSCCCDFNRGYMRKYLDVDHQSLNFSDFDTKQCMNTEKSEGGGNRPVSSMESTPGSPANQYVTLSLGEPQADNDSTETIVSGEDRVTTEYTPVKYHWFYRADVDEEKSIWRGFSVSDSQALETAFLSPDLNENTLVPTDGGRYDVNVMGRLRIPVYWKAKPTNVRRCSWFYKGTTDARYVPYTEPVAELLEEEYRHGLTTGEWHRRLVLPSNELVVMHGPAVMVHFQQQDARDSFSAAPTRTNQLYEFTFGKRLYRNLDTLNIRVSRDQEEKVDHLIFLVHGAGEYKITKERIQSAMRPRVVRRGSDESEIEDFEPSNIDHLLLLCHGVGSACDMRFRSVEEVVEDFRTSSCQLLRSHYRNSYENGIVGRVEVLPISWHETLHSGETGVDRRLAWITLDSIPRLRNFTNDTVLDVLFYTSPVFCQTIIDTVCSEMNRIYKLFRERNPSFSGGVSLGGHSLGSVILYDLLCHQTDKMGQKSKISPKISPFKQRPAQAPESKQFVLGQSSTTHHNIKYPRLDFSPEALYALGSPIAIFECIRGVESLGLDFKLPTCPKFFNIFHPYDPIAYRIEPLVNQQLRTVKPYLIPHHKGRKRMHLELKDTMARVGADIKQKLMESIKNTWANVWRTQPTPIQLEKVVEEEIEREELRESRDEQNQNGEQPTPDQLGRLNAGSRIDYVLQEAPFEMLNEYLFAMSSHVCYWESEDTMLLMLREIYDALGVQPDCTVPQPSLTVQRTRTVVDGGAIGEENIASSSTRM